MQPNSSRPQYVIALVLVAILIALAVAVWFRQMSQPNQPAISAADDSAARQQLFSSLAAQASAAAVVMSVEDKQKLLDSLKAGQQNQKPMTEVERAALLKTLEQSKP